MDVNVGDWQEVDGRLLSFITPELGLFDTISKKSLYLDCVKYLNLRELKDLPETKWTNFVESGGDLQWQISNWILATNCYKVHLNPLQGEECLFCGLSETVFHMFIGCSRLFGILALLRDLSHNFGFIFTNNFFSKI